MKAKLQVSLPGEPDRHYPIDTRAIVGKGPTADVSLDNAVAITKQHFRIKLGPNELDVRLAPGAPPLTYEGRPFSGGTMPYGADFYLDRIRFSCVQPQKPGTSKVIPLAIACAVVIVGMVAMSMLEDGSMDGGGAAEEAEIVLFGEAAACPQPDPAGAARKAEALELAARAKRERYRYEPHDGLDAGKLFAEASKCYAAAGDQAGQARVDQEGQAWRQRITEEFRAAQLRLRTARQNKQLEAALSAVTSMRRMLRGESHPYDAKLQSQERQLKLDIEKKRKK